MESAAAALFIFLALLYHWVFGVEAINALIGAFLTIGILSLPVLIMNTWKK